MQFYSEHFLNLLWLAPVLALCFWGSGILYQKRLRSFLKTKDIQQKLIPHYQKGEWAVRSVLLLAAFISAVLALAQPQWGEEKKKVERKGVDLIFLLDVSTSMLAEDIKPSRVQKAKFEIESFVQAFSGHRIGMLTFAGSSFLQTPLTLDYSAFLIFLSGVDVGHVPDPGTSLGPALVKAMEAFPDDKGKHRALIVFSDGEDHEIHLEQALEMAKQKHVRIYTVGSATADGAPIPLKDDKGVQAGVKKDRAGNIVITKLNKEILSRVANETGGLYVPVTPSEKEVDLILKHMATLGEKKLEDRLITEKEDHYQIFLIFAFLCLVLEMLVRRSVSSRVLAVIPLFFFLGIHSGFIETSQGKVDQGNQDFEGKRYQSAAQKYREVQVKNPDSAPVNYNLATSLYKMDQYQESAANLKKAVDQSKDSPELQAKAAYNYGNALFRTGDYEGAIEAYKKALEINPQDEDAKYNLEYIQNQKSKFEKENQDRKKDNPQKKDQQNKQQNNQNQQQNQQSQQQQNQGGGSSQKQDKNQGQNSQQNQQGSGEQKQNQNQGGQGQNQQNSGQNQNQDQKDQGQGQNQQDQQNQSGQSEKDQNKSSQSGGQGEQDQNQKSDQSQGEGAGDQKKQDPGQGQNQQDQQDQQGQGQDQKDQQGGGSQDQQNQQGQEPEQKDQKSGGSSGQQDPKQSQQQGQQPPQESGGQSGQNQPKDQPGSGGQGTQQQGQKPQEKPGEQPTGGGAAGGAAGQGGEQGQQGGQGGGPPLQGQMTKENAEYLLASLEEGEKKFQVMRKPAAQQSENPYIEKDW